MIKINKEQLREKIHGCWLGKNIGGTMGTPYEGRRNINDIKGFVTKPGEVLANDDLDLQLIWLIAAEEEGLIKLSSAKLAEYWISYVPAHWNEYGIGKSNLKAGFMPPLSGEYGNERWKNSNGAWIRSEIWASLYPGFPNLAMNFGYMDASVDHGISEGTYAEMFTASLESYAYFESDIRKIVEFGLSKIPADCRVARSVRLVLDSYDKGVDYRQLREMIVEDSKDLGWFQAPANVAFTVLGLIYGEGDFKKSMIYAINCGDDTDCTGATVGAVLGIIKGKKGIPEDWASYLGDNIVSVAIDASSIRHLLPKTCTELTDKVLNLIPSALKAFGIDMEYTDGETEIPPELMQEAGTDIEKELLWRAPYSYDGPDNPLVKSIVEFTEKPQIAPGKTLHVKVKFRNKRPDQRHLNIKLHLPEGWTASYQRNVHIWNSNYESDYVRLSEIISDDEIKDVGFGALFEADITAGENVGAMNNVVLEATCPGRPTVILIPITIAG